MTKLLMLALVVPVVTVVSAATADARPMRVAVFEASAYAEPRDDAAVVEVFIEGTELSVSEESQGGWVRVRLGSGGVGWMREDALRASRDPATLLRREEPSPQPDPPATARPSTPAPRTTQIYVKDLDHLAELVREDTVVHPMAARLVSQDTAATALMWSGVGIGGVVMLVGVATMDPTGDDSSLPMILVGGSIMIVGVIASLATRPGRRDLLDVINSWNTRHPSEPFTIDP